MRYRRQCMATGTSLIGTAVNRVEGRAKITGAAQYAAEAQLANMAYAVMVGSTAASAATVPGGFEMDASRFCRTPPKALAMRSRWPAAGGIASRPRPRPNQTACTMIAVACRSACSSRHWPHPRCPRGKCFRCRSGPERPSDVQSAHRWHRLWHRAGVIRGTRLRSQAWTASQHGSGWLPRACAG